MNGEGKQKEENIQFFLVADYLRNIHIRQRQLFLSERH